MKKEHEQNVCFSQDKDHILLLNLPLFVKRPLYVSRLHLSPMLESFDQVIIELQESYDVHHQTFDNGTKFVRIYEERQRVVWWMTSTMSIDSFSKWRYIYSNTYTYNQIDDDHCKSKQLKEKSSFTLISFFCSTVFI